MSNFVAVLDENNILKAELFGLFLFGFGYFGIFERLHGPEVGSSCKFHCCLSEIYGFGKRGLGGGCKQAALSVTSPLECPFCMPLVAAVEADQCYSRRSCWGLLIDFLGRLQPQG